MHIFALQFVVLELYTQSWRFLSQSFGLRLRSSGDGITNNFCGRNRRDLGVLGRCEAALCRAHGRKSFGDLGLGIGFGTFLARHAAQILEASGPVGGTPSRLAAEIARFCAKLRRAHAANANNVIKRKRKRKDKAIKRTMK